jgi:hypothetical protein
MAELRRLLEFMYCGRVSVEQHQLEPLLEAAKMLGIRGLASGVSSFPCIMHFCYSFFSI